MQCKENPFSESNHMLHIQRLVNDFINDMKRDEREEYFNRYHPLNANDTQFVTRWILRNKRKLIRRKTLYLTDKELKGLLKSIRFITKNKLVTTDIINKFVQENITKIVIEEGSVIADKYVTYWHPKYAEFIKDNFIMIWISDFKFDIALKTKIKNLCHVSDDLLDKILTKNEI
eukprot:455750_1